MVDETIKTLAVKIALDDGSFRDGMNSLKKQLEGADSNFKSSVAGLKDWGKSLDNLKGNASSLSEKINLQKQVIQQYASALSESKTALEQHSQKMLDNKAKLDSARNAYEESAASIGKNAEETKKLKEQMDSAQTAYERSEKTVRNNSASIEGYNIQLNNAKGKLKEFQSELDTTNSKIAAFKWNELKSQISDVGKTFESVGKQITAAGEKLTAGITVPLAGVAAAAVNTGNEYESQMSRVKAISGATSDEFKQLNDQAIQLGADTAFSAKEAAEGMENLASAGFNTKEIMAAMPGMLDLAASSGEDLATSSDIAASTLRGFGLAADQAGHVADVLAKNSAQTNAAVGDTGEAMKYIAPVALNAGWSLEQVTAAIGEMSNAGIKGEQAGTTLRGALTSLMNPSSAQAGAMQTIGFTAYDTSGKMKSLSEIIGELREKTSGLTDEQRDDAIATIMGTNALSGMQILLKDGSASLDDLTASLVDSTGAASDMAKTMQDNVKGSIEQAKGSIESLAIKFQQTAAPAIKEVADKVQDLANKVLAMTPDQQQMLLKLAGVASAAGPAAMGLGKIVEATGKLHIGMSDGIGSIQKFVSEGSEKFDAFKDTLSSFNKDAGQLGGIQKLQSGFSSLGAKIQSLTEPIGASLGKIKTNISSAFGNVFDKLPSGLKTSMGKVSGSLTSEIPKLQGMLTKYGGHITDGLQKVVGGAMKVFAPGVLVAAILVGLGAADQQMNGKLVEMIENVAKKGPQLIQNFVTSITSRIPELVDEGTKVLNALIDAISTNGPVIISGAVQVMTTLVNSLTNNLPQLIPAAFDCIMTLVNALIDNLPLILQSGLKLLVALIQGITSDPKKLVDTIVSLVIKISQVIIENLPTIIEAAVQIMVALISGLAQALPELVEQLPVIIGAIWDGLKSVNWAELGLEILKGIGEGLADVGKALWGIIQAAGNGIVNGFKNFFGIHSPSTLMRDEIGKNLGLGISNGLAGIDFMSGVTDQIGRSKIKIQNAIQGLSGSVNVGVNAQMQPAYAGAYSAQQAAQYGTTVPQYLHATINIGGEKVDSTITPIIGASLNKNTIRTKQNMR